MDKCRQDKCPFDNCLRLAIAVFPISSRRGNMTNCQHKHYLLEYFLKKISTHQKMLKITTFMFYFAGIIHSFKIKPTFWGGNYFVKLNLVCNSLKSHKFNHNFVTSTFKSNFEASYIIFYGS